MKKFLLVVVFLSNFFWISETKAQTAVIRPITFPVIGAVTYYDDFGAPRVGHTHEGNDLMGKKMLPLVAAVNGTIRQVVYPEATWGYSVIIEDAEGYTYHYLHMNNDAPGTDDGKGDGSYAYGVDIMRGNKVVAGQLIGWMGDSGNAEGTSAHLHFEIHKDGQVFSPYESLRAAAKITTPVDYPALSYEILPFGGFQGGASIAVGNLDADSDVEIVAGASAGGGPHVQIFDKGVQTPKSGFFAYVQGFRGGIDVAAGDIDGDGVDEIITGPAKGGGPNVKVFKADGTEVSSFMAYAPGFLGGIKIAAADLNNDGKAEIITSPGTGGGPHVKMFSLVAGQVEPNLFGEFLAYDDAFKAGIDVTALKSSGSNPARIITAPNAGGGPHVKVFDTTGIMTAEFMAYDPNHRGGVRVGASNGQIITAPLLGGPDIRKYDLLGNKLDNDNAFEEWWSGSWDVAAYNGQVYTSTGPGTRRRTSIRELDFETQRRFRFEENNQK